MKSNDSGAPTRMSIRASWLLDVATEGGFLRQGQEGDAALAPTDRIVHSFDLGLDQPVYLSASIGFAFYPFIPSAPIRITWEPVIAIADRALYGAKASGRNAWVGIFSTPATPLDAVHLISHMPELLAREGRIDVQTSVSDREGSVDAARLRTRARCGAHADCALIGLKEGTEAAGTRAPTYVTLERQLQTSS
jgi:hypothetical protein